MVMHPKHRALTEFDRQIIGGPKRISIPLENRTALRDFADALRGLATTLEIQSRLDTPEYYALITCKIEIDHTNALIREACNRHGIKLRLGRPRLSERKGNDGETSETRPPEKTLHLVKDRS